MSPFSSLSSCSPRPLLLFSPSLRLSLLLQPYISIHVSSFLSLLFFNPLLMSSLPAFHSYLHVLYSFLPSFHVFLRRSRKRNGSSLTRRQGKNNWRETGTQRLTTTRMMIVRGRATVHRTSVGRCRRKNGKERGEEGREWDDVANV